MQHDKEYVLGVAGVAEDCAPQVLIGKQFSVILEVLDFCECRVCYVVYAVSCMQCGQYMFVSISPFLGIIKVNKFYRQIESVDFVCARCCMLHTNLRFMMPYTNFLACFKSLVVCK